MTTRLYATNNHGPEGIDFRVLDCPTREIAKLWADYLLYEVGFWSYNIVKEK